MLVRGKGVLIRRVEALHGAAVLVGGFRLDTQITLCERPVLRINPHKPGSASVVRKKRSSRPGITALERTRGTY